MTDFEDPCIDCGQTECVCEDDEAPLTINAAAVSSIRVDGPLVRELLALIREARTALAPMLTLYGPRGTEIKR